MLGYGMVKAAVHQMTASLATEGAKLPANTTTAAILPQVLSYTFQDNIFCRVMLDTPANRSTMPDADKSTWTPLEEVAK